LPETPESLFAGDQKSQQRFVRFKPPKLEKTAEGVTLSLPHIRLDKALEFLIGDKLR
jgi:predicted YcjX-like family ATPase